MPARVLQLALLIAASGAVALMIGFGGDLAALAGLGAMALGTVLAAPAAREAETRWWALLAAGTAVAGAGEALSLLTETFGGLVSAIGAIAALVAVVVAFPTE